MFVDHEERISAEGDYRFKDFTRVSQRFVEGSLADRNNLDEFLLGVEKDHSKRFVRKKNDPITIALSMLFACSRHSQWTKLFTG
jgi:hypothetical protein